MKKSLILALVAVLVFSLAGAAFAFTDTDNHWAKTYVNKLVDLKIVNGVSATSFNPEGKVTRAEFAKMLVNAKGLSLETPATATFTDVAKDAWYFPYVEAAVKAKLVEGVGDGKFAPTALVTREQVAKMIVLAAGKTADDTKAINFDDKAQISDWAKGFVAVAADLKLITGYNNKFNPKANATRAEAAKLTYSELVYEGKIVEEVVVDANLLTEINPSTLVIGDKSYDITDGTEYLVGTQLVTKNVLKEDTKVTFTLSASNKIAKVVVDAPDYTNIKGEVTEVGEDSTDPYVVVGDKKVYVDTADDEYYTAYIDDTNDEPVDIAQSSNALPELNKDYVVVYNSAGYAQYAIKLATSNTTGTLETVSEDTDGKFLVISGKKYYFKKDGSNYDVDLADAQYLTEDAAETFANAYAYLKTVTGDRIEFETNSEDKITWFKTTSVDMEGIAGTPLYYESGSNYIVYVPVALKSDKNYSTTSFTYLAKTYSSSSDKASIEGAYADDEAIKKVDAAIAGAKSLDTEDARAYLGSAKLNLWDVKRNNYVTAELDKDSAITKVNVYNKVAYGLVDSFEKSSDKVTTITVNGTKFDYAGESVKLVSTTKGNVTLRGVGEVKGTATIKAGYLAAAVLNADGKIVSFNLLFDPTEAYNGYAKAKVIVVGKAGQVSKLSKTDAKNTDGKEVTIPSDTLEVSVDFNGATKYAWVTYNDEARYANTTTMSVKGTKDLMNVAIGDTIYVYGISSAFSQTIIPLDDDAEYNNDTKTYGSYATNNTAIAIFAK